MTQIIAVKEWITRNTPPKNIVRALNVSKARQVVAWQEKCLKDKLLYLLQRRKALAVPLLGSKVAQQPSQGNDQHEPPNR